MAHPVVGARVLLREGIRPSTMGVSDAAGKFQLWTRSGVASAIIVAPADSGLPEARVAETPGIVVDDNLRDLTMSWDSSVRAPFGVVVRSIDGTTAGGRRAGARGIGGGRHPPRRHPACDWASDHDPCCQRVGAAGWNHRCRRDARCFPTCP